MTSRDHLITAARTHLTEADRLKDLYHQERAKARDALMKLTNPDGLDLPLREVARDLGRPESNLRYLLNNANTAGPDPAPTEETPPR
ncbi:hypothetical protein OOJ91_33990 [Micromonospora lupini]|uniref:hypothetical protein n=1 Tax=Micromonospora lupini TaxID=285679 RepID=UPI0022568E66|nr:hypothetical protein [Micromonospora lupini]MCX5070860.1 hypothetical protein [Micromonospora lupini]